MIKKSLICFLSVLFFINFVFAELELKPYLDKANEMILNLPVGWEISRYQADNILVASLNEDREDVPVVQVMALPFVENPKNDLNDDKKSVEDVIKDLLLMLAFEGMNQDAASELNIIEEKEVSDGLGQLMIIETSVASNFGGQTPVRLALLLESSPKRKLIIVAMFAATPKEFESFGGEDFLMEITNSIQRLNLRSAGLLINSSILVNRSNDLY